MTLWKNGTFLIGLAWLVWGSLFFDFPDWTIGVSLAMAIPTYLTADWSAGVLLARKYKLWPLAAFATWFCVDGTYWLYWSLVRPEVMIREGQWGMSLCLYLLCGLIWRIDPRVLWATVRAGLRA